VPHLETAEADAVSNQLQERLHGSATGGPPHGGFSGFKSAAEIRNIGEISFGKHLSRGTSGTVSQALWQGMNVAVKRFFYTEGCSSHGGAVAGGGGPTEAETRAAFENEVFLMRQLQHTNLVRFFGAHSRPPDLCIIMELMRGSLTDLLYGKLSRDASKVLTPSRQLGIVAGISCGEERNGPSSVLPPNQCFPPLSAGRSVCLCICLSVCLPACLVAFGLADEELSAGDRLIA
jgi:serine/threonine protein kinase